jgi:tetratricopeptide (TPR) repeat protein
MSLEFSAPAATIGPTRHDNAADLLGAAEGGAIERDHAAAGMFLLRAQAPRRAWTHLPAAVEARPEDRDTVAAFVEAAAAVGHLRDAETTVERLIIQYPRGLALRLEYAKLLAARGDLSRAHEHIASAAAIFPQDHALIETMAAISADAEDVETLRTAVARLRRLQPHASSTLYYDAVLALLSGRAEAARDLARRAVAADASYAAAWNLLGVSLGAIEAPADDVRAAFQRAIAADPSDAASYVNLGMLDLRMGRPAAAIDNFAQALTLDPANASARDGLALARRSLL